MLQLADDVPHPQRGGRSPRASADSPTPPLHHSQTLRTGSARSVDRDITLLKGPRKREFFYLYVIIDLFSRYVVGWCVAMCESEELAEHFIAQTCQRQEIGPDQLVLHADRGAVMRSKVVGELLSTLGVQRSHSRPRISNDNPMSESQFKTLKYHSTFPERFADLEDARQFCVRWFQWYNNEHHHVGLALLTPWQVYSGGWEEVLSARQATLDAAYDARPDRFVRGRPKVGRPPSEVWINRPLESSTSGVEGSREPR